MGVKQTGLAATLLLALSGVSPALAGDIASIQTIGFSPDAKVFAFEEYGVQDGSGFPYSTIYFIDTDKDAYLPGTPIRVRLDKDLEPLGEARKEAHQKAENLISKYHLDDNPGILAAFNPISELGTDPHKLQYLTVQASPAFSKPYTLQLNETSFPLPDRCKNLTESYVGFSLEFTEIQGKAAAQTVYTDKAVPKSRGCVRGYRLAGVALTGKNQGPQMALVEIKTFGFEGNDGRWIAIPLRPDH